MVNLPIISMAEFNIILSLQNQDQPRKRNSVLAKHESAPLVSTCTISDAILYLMLLNPVYFHYHTTNVATIIDLYTKPCAVFISLPLI